MQFITKPNKEFEFRTICGICLATFKLSDPTYFAIIEGKKESICEDCAEEPVEKTIEGIKSTIAYLERRIKDLSEIKPTDNKPKKRNYYH